MRMLELKMNKYCYFKRVVDIAASILLISITSPLLILFAVLVKAESQGGVFYRQRRLGYRGKTFQILKFRSMRADNQVASDVQIFGGEPSVTRTGAVMRRLKIDELPQLFNVLFGDMSLVGPRPCLPQLQNDFNDDGRARLAVRPGITGLAQISGNIHLSWQERWKLDRFYVEHLSFDLDLDIILRTVAIVLMGDKWGVKK